MAATVMRLHHRPGDTEAKMSEPEEKPARQPFFHYVEYVREDPHPKFTAFQLGFIRSIDEFLTPQEVHAVSEVESFEIRLEDGDVICHEVPGLRARLRMNSGV